MYIMYIEKFLHLSRLRDKYQELQRKLKKEFNKNNRNLTVLETLILEKKIVLSTKLKN